MDCQGPLARSGSGLVPVRRFSKRGFEGRTGRGDAFTAHPLRFLRHSPVFEPREGEIGAHSPGGISCDTRGTSREELAMPRSPLFAWHSLLFAPHSPRFAPFELGGMEREELFEPRDAGGMGREESFERLEAEGMGREELFERLEGGGTAHEGPFAPLEAELAALSLAFG